VKVAAIDIGSNSVHMVVVEAVAGRDLRVLDREKEMVRLGDSAFADGRLSASAQARALTTIGRFLELARRRGVDAVTAAATSAVREADNGSQFLALVRKETGQHVNLLGEHEEARLIYLAVRDAMDLRGRPALIVDVGGGSTELVVGDATAMRYAASLPLGVLRLNAHFHGRKALRGRTRRALREHVRALIHPAVRAARGAAVRRVIGTAGTVNAMARILLAGGEDLADPDTSAVARIPSKGISDLAERLLSMPIGKRLRVPGMDPARADSLGLGCVVVDEILGAMRADTIFTCRAAVREGMVLDYLATHPEGPRARLGHDVRERSVRDAAARYGQDDAHGEQVSRLALALFDGTRRLHRLGDEERELLHLAALLHDVGQHVEYRRHHRHSWYLVKNAELQGFEPDEIEVLACLCRYHRRAAPKEDHPEWQALPERLRPTALALIGLLRVADGLDRGHSQEVDRIAVDVRRRSVIVTVTGRGALELDVIGARGKADVLEEALGRPVELEMRLRRPRDRRAAARRRARR
jgi:exopolyphosphatase/guanosine-5'-triphosphate,3'-diphosphate pyrophosphatase